MAKYQIEVNSEIHAVEAEPDTPLLWVLRDSLDLTGTKYGCGEGVCGTCTVLLDGMAVRSCTTSIAAVNGREITTIEGLAKEGKLHPVQQAFLDALAFQCGYCTPGMIMETVAFLEETPKPTDDDTRQRLEGNICRCGTYPRIIEAVRLAAKRGKP